MKFGFLSGAIIASAAMIISVFSFNAPSGKFVSSLTPDTPAATTDAVAGPDSRRDVFIAAKNAPTATALSEGTWINSGPLKVETLRGQVVIVDFWTFGCYNCRNTLPTLKRWDERYRDQGLTIIGVHTPESDYEKNTENVRRAVREQNIRYPVVTDNEGETWRAYRVEAWPTTIILDKRGRIRYTHIGEGAYDEMESVIKKLLAEKTSAAEGNSSAAKEITKVIKTEEEWRSELTPEQFYVTRQKGTERAFSGAYWNNHEEGEYDCVACGLPLFSSETKFESGTGWPSFYQPIASINIHEESDTSYGMTRTEVECRRCGAHLGHVFPDGPRPTGLRYCINSAALKFNKKA